MSSLPQKSRKSAVRKEKADVLVAAQFDILGEELPEGGVGKIAEDLLSFSVFTAVESPGMVLMNTKEGPRMVFRHRVVFGFRQSNANEVLAHALQYRNIVLEQHIVIFMMCTQPQFI